jgi:hypothetical protein
MVYITRIIHYRLNIRVSGYRSIGLGFDFWHYQIFREVVGLELGPLSLMALLGRNNSVSGLEYQEYGCRDPSHFSIVCSCTQTMEYFSFLLSERKS